MNCTASESALDGSATYGRAFWLTYASNLAIMVAICLLYRYADLVLHLGGDEFHLGWIVGTGMVGSLLMRLVMGRAIDHYGTRAVWLASTGGYVVACLGHLVVSRYDTPLIYALRMLYQTSVSGFFGASITHVSLRSSPAKMAEVVGTLGTSGFIGMILGPTLADAILGPGPVTVGQLQTAFLTAAALGCVSSFCGFLATRGELALPHSPPMALIPLLRRYRPSFSLLAITACVGMGIGLPGVFLRTYLEELHVPGISFFFWVYAVVAFVTRMSIRRLPERWGIPPMVLLGMAALVLATWGYLPVVARWQLVLPAVPLGVAHAFLFPAVMAGGSGPFPDRYRGLGTTLMLAMLDLGGVVGAPLAGGLLRLAKFQGWPRYPFTFVVLGLTFAAITAWYAVHPVRREPPLPESTQEPPTQPYGADGV